MSLPIVARFEARLAAADARFRAQSTRERWLLSAMFLAVAAFSLDSVLIRPLEAMRSQVVVGAAQGTDRVRELEARIEAVRNPVLTDEESRQRDELRQLEQQITEIDREISGAVSRLVPPEAAVDVLEELLAHDDRLELVTLTSEAPRRLGPEATQGASTLYQHGLRIEIQGDFAAALDYLQRIEQSRWQLLWDRFEFKVESFPDARITLELHTLSEREEWVGV
jgi:MSHA biogenesis protein MshJ